jgi:hypothetical protein
MQHRVIIAGGCMPAYQHRFFALMIVSVFMLSFFVADISAKSAGGQKAVGFVARIDGTGYLMRDGKKYLLSAMDLLFTSDTIIVSVGSRIRINLLPGEGYEIDGQAQFTLGNKSVFAKMKTAKRFAVDQRACAAAVDLLIEENGRVPASLAVNRTTDGVSLENGGERSGVYRIRGGGNSGKPVLFMSKLLYAKPLLFWNRIKGAVRYAIEVRNGTESLWSAECEAPAIEYPANAPSLDGKSDLVAVICALDADGEVLAEGINEFEMDDRALSEAFRDKQSMILATDDIPARQVILARFYESYGLIPLAISEYEKGIKSFGKDEGLRRRVDLLGALVD